MFSFGKTIMDKFRFTAGPWTLVHDEHGHTLQYDTGYEPSGLPSPPFVVNMADIEELNDLLYVLLRCSQCSTGEK